ncbi:MAG: hypothetical protein MJK04_09610 [Psychrosphaera sp.]|nr:hypothetical protein [Psychrosphaera sp.]
MKLVVVSDATICDVQKIVHYFFERGWIFFMETIVDGLAGAYLHYVG